LNDEPTDLAELTEAIRSRVGDSVDGAVLGRTRLRDAAQDELGCSAIEADRIVETMALRGLVRLARDPLGHSKWNLGGRR
jgi:hypothetical protein